MDATKIEKLIDNNNKLIKLYLLKKRSDNKPINIISTQEYEELDKKIDLISCENIHLLNNILIENNISDKPLYIFYHCFLRNRWEEIFNRQLKKIVDSGLYDKCNEILINAVGNKNEIEKLKTIISKYNKFVIFCYSEENTYEFVPLIKAKEFCEINDCNIFYLHLKGVTKDNDNCWAWTKYLEYFCIENWKLCVLTLDLGYDCSGTQFVIRGDRNRKLITEEDEYHYLLSNFYYEGNFFFATSDYIKTLPKLIIDKKSRYYKKSRYKCEHWIGLNNPKAFCFRIYLKSLYDTQIKECDYIIKT